MSQSPRNDNACRATSQEGATGAGVDLRCEEPFTVFSDHVLEDETYRNGVVRSADVGIGDDAGRCRDDMYAIDDSDDDDAEDSDYASASLPRFYVNSTASSKEGLCQLSSPSKRCPHVLYDPQDHTAPGLMQKAPPSSSSGKVQRRRLWVLPREALPPQYWASLRPTRSSLDAAAKSDGDADAHVSDGRVSACAPTRSIAAAASPAAGGGAHTVLQNASHLDLTAVRSVTPSPQCTMNATVVRLPHPRHGQPFLCLVVRDPAMPVLMGASTAALSSSASASSSLLYEVQAQAPPSGFAQSWFVNAQVVPSTVGDGELLVATPLDLTFFALYELLGDAQRYEGLSRTFMSAEELYRARDLSVSGVTSASADGRKAAAAEASAFVSVFSGIGGGGEESKSSSASTSAPFTAEPFARSGGDDASVSVGPPPSWSTHQPPRAPAFSFSSPMPGGKSSGGNRRGWAGWAHATVAHPLLLQHCLSVLQSDGVLRRLCEVRETGAEFSAQTATSNAPEDSRHTVYYRPSESVAVEWLKRRVEHVRASPVLREILQLPDRSSAATATAAATAPPETTEEVPMSIAFGVVAEYVPDRLHTALAVACGLPNPAQAAISSPTAAAPFDAAMRHRDGGELSTKRKAVGTASAGGPKSASVRRLEKAGQPKGTPTLLDMFAKKKPKVESGTP
ncbi:hypothetical protein LSCM4_07670 [Leishmania orientalis]|uniref:Rnh202 triple barrel domain-containing protein n=1 Tax=Leishmania orientalis TaxID=2249476 RepID=A0A836KTC0_9TRYP|nr:hypothetical protein LSCM4_07670 [Leishmania orientalis]